MKLGWSSDSTLFSIDSQLPSGGISCLKSERSKIGDSRPTNLTEAPESETTNEDLFSKTHLQCQTPGRSSSIALT